MTQIGLDFSNPKKPRGPKTLTVTEAVRGADRCLSQAYSAVWIEGEISNLRLASSGHAYFTLKDDDASLPTAMFRSALQRVRFRFEEGLKIRVFGRMGIYPAQGRFQFYAEKAEVAGLGDRMVALEQLKRKLAAEGLFDQANKSNLPRWPTTIGVVTSAQGAAIHDISKVVQRRYPSRIVLAPALVQGDEAPQDILRALYRLQRRSDIDVIIVGRGGGSVEDLWAFNDERLVRAVAACPLPTISAVGHEVDTTLCDLVADVRAATPSQAGELVVPDREGLKTELEQAKRRLGHAIERKLLDERSRLERSQRLLERRGRRWIGVYRQRLAQGQRLLVTRSQHRLSSTRRELQTLQARLMQLHPRAQIAKDRARLAAVHEQLIRFGDSMIARLRLRLGTAAGKLHALSPLSVLERGYSVTRKLDGSLVRDAASLKSGDAIEIRLQKGLVQAEVISNRIAVAKKAVAKKAIAKKAAKKKAAKEKAAKEKAVKKET